MHGWKLILVALGLTILNFLCVGLTLLQLPGLWLMLLASVLVKALLDAAMFSWWTLGASALLCLVAEVVELAAGAAGAKSAGGSRRAAWSALVGGVIGALVGTFVVPVPVIGTLLGAALGSGFFAAGAELTVPGRTGKAAIKVATGAAKGRLYASVWKLGFAAVNAVILSAAAFIP